MDGALEASFVLYPQLSPGPRLQAARPRRQSVASPATREFKFYYTDQWLVLLTGQLPVKIRAGGGRNSQPVIKTAMELGFVAVDPEVPAAQ
jgi:hypothetical protein